MSILELYHENSVGIFGKSGVGKTLTVRNLLDQVQSNKVTIIDFDGHENSYNRFTRYYPANNIHVINMIADTVLRTPGKPIIVLEGVDGMCNGNTELAEYISNLIKYEKAFIIYTAQRLTHELENIIANTSSLVVFSVNDPENLLDGLDAPEHNKAYLSVGYGEYQYIDKNLITE